MDYAEHSKTCAHSRPSLRGASVAAAFAVLAGCGSEESGHSRPAVDASVPPVEAVVARSGVLPFEERLSGIVRAANQVTIRPEIEAPVVEVLIRSGDAVERGQPLVRLDSRTLEDQLRQAEASVRLAEAAAREAEARIAELEAQHSRTAALAAQELISQLEVETLAAQLAAARAARDQAAARVDQARAEAEERRSALARTVVRAPVAGHVGQRNVEVGMLVEPTTELFVIGNLQELIVEIPLTEKLLEHVREGQPVRISAPVLGARALEAAIARISPFLESGSFSTIAEIDVRDERGRLRPGMFVTVDVLYGETEQATIVPESALWEDPESGTRGVYVVACDPCELASPAQGEPRLSHQALAVSFHPVEIVAKGGGAAAVRGVEPDSWVVTLGQHLLRADAGATARVRATSWDRVLDLQGLQREDLLRGFLERQQDWARERGAEPPTNEEFLGGGAAPAAAP
jgi:RND family efflux transporter MFP subunit